VKTLFGKHLPGSLQNLLLPGLANFPILVSGSW
jgi:hypothetical protein